MDNEITVGFIGAGRVGVTLGRYFFANGLKISGYYSKTPEHARSAAQLTCGKSFETPSELAEESRLIFITVPDAQIYKVFLQLKSCELKNKILCHCSGALPAAVFSGIEATGAYGCCVHPIFAVSDKENSYKEISRAFFTLEGDAACLPVIEKLFQKLQNPYQIIAPGQKQKYHAALVTASNLVIGLYSMSVGLLEECGFSSDFARKALVPLFLNNAETVSRVGCANALTGPVERNDLFTVKQHLKALSDGEDASVLSVYKALSGELLKIAEAKYPQRDYTELRALLNEA